MSGAVKEAVTLMEVLPESDQNFALEFIKKLVLAWDPDYTRRQIRGLRTQHLGII